MQIKKRLVTFTTTTPVAGTFQVIVNQGEVVVGAPITTKIELTGTIDSVVELCETNLEVPFVDTCECP